MKMMIKSAVCAAVTLAFGAGIAWADGTYKLYSIGEATPMGEISIQDDVKYDGTEYATWWVPDQQMFLYIPTEAAYVTMDANNPIIGKKFTGGWFSHKTREELGSAACEESEKDHAGKERFYGGDLQWTVTSLTDNYEFEISLGACEGAVTPWASNVDAKG